MLLFYHHLTRMCIDVVCSSLPKRPLAAFYRVIMAALTACSPNLLHLGIHFYLDLARCRFPLLQGFSTTSNIPFTSALYSFLQNHTTLEILELQSNAIDYRAIAPISVPRLQRFTGSDRIIDTFIFGSWIRKIHIIWTSDTIARIEKVLHAFSSSADSVQSFRSSHMEFHAQFVGTFSRIFPHINVLHLELFTSQNVSFDSLLYCL